MNNNTYIPGVCNIGKAEVERRSSKLKTSLLLIALSTALFFILPFNFPIFIVTSVLTCYASILIFQIRQKFCIVFGWMSVFNFNTLAERKIKVENEASKRMDRIQAIKILCYTAILSFLFISIIFLLKKII